MTRTATGWAYVAVQAALLIALVLLPTGSAWPVPPWLATLAQALVVLGFVIMIAAALGLGRALTPTPVPNRRGDLRTGGLYKLVRHPIYSGVLVIVIGITLRTRSWVGLALGLATIAFFNAKARWEEARLAEAYPNYGEYAARTPRFIPRLPR